MKDNNVITPFMLFIVFYSIIAAFFFGWVFPVEGPIDYIYDDYVGNKTIKKPVVSAPALPEEKYNTDIIDMEDMKEVLIDLNEDGEQEWYLFFPLLKGEK